MRFPVAMFDCRWVVSVVSRRKRCIRLSGTWWSSAFYAIQHRRYWRRYALEYSFEIFSHSMQDCGLLFGAARKYPQRQRLRTTLKRRLGNIWQGEINILPESVWAKGSSNSGGRSNIFTSSHHIFTSHLQFSRLLIFTSSHLHIFSSSHLHILTSSHLHILTSSHLLIFTSSHLHITSLHLLIFTSSTHLQHIFSSSHLHILISSHLRILTSSHLLIFTSSTHLQHIFSSSHLHILTSSHLHIFTFSLALLLSCPLSLLLSSSSFFSISLLRRGAVPTRRHETQPFRTKGGWIAKNWGEIAILQPRRQPFRTKWGSIAKNWNKIAILKCPRQRFRTKWGSIAKSWGKMVLLCVKSVCV